MLSGQKKLQQKFHFYLISHDFEKSVFYVMNKSLKENMQCARYSPFFPPVSQTQCITMRFKAAYFLKVKLINLVSFDSPNNGKSKTTDDESFRKIVS